MPSLSQPDSPLRQDVLRALRRKGILPEAKAAWVVATANAVAKGRFRAATFRDGELVCVTGSLPVAELQLLSHEYRRAINKRLGQEIVKTIRFKAQ